MTVQQAPVDGCPLQRPAPHQPCGSPRNARRPPQRRRTSAHSLRQRLRSVQAANAAKERGPGDTVDCRSSPATAGPLNASAGCHSVPLQCVVTAQRHVLHAAPPGAARPGGRARRPGRRRGAARRAGAPPGAPRHSRISTSSARASAAHSSPDAAPASGAPSGAGAASRSAGAAPAPAARPMISASALSSSLARNSWCCAREEAAGWSGARALPRGRQAGGSCTAGACTGPVGEHVKHLAVCGTTQPTLDARQPCTTALQRQARQDQGTRRAAHLHKTMAGPLAPHREQAPQRAALQQQPARGRGTARWVLRGRRAGRQPRAQVPRQLRGHVAQEQELTK